MSDNVYFKRIYAATVLDICELSYTLSSAQRQFVADNSVSIAQAHFSENAWFRAIYAGEKPVVFIMTHEGSDYDDGIDEPGVFLWRLMIGRQFQGRGYGKKAVELLIKNLKERAVIRLKTSYDQGKGSPEEFYKKLGFVPDGEMYGEEIGAEISF